jgi:hypothetical protein
MTNNLIWASTAIKRGFVGCQMPTKDFMNDINFTTAEQKMLLSDLSGRESVDEMIFQDDKPFIYPESKNISLPMDDLVKKMDNTEVVSKDIEYLTEPPKKDDTKELIINGALVFLGALVVIKLLS